MKNNNQLKTFISAVRDKKIIGFAATYLVIGIGMVEFIVIAQKREYRIKEFPVSWKENSRHIYINFVMNFFIPALKLWRRLNF